LAAANDCKQFVWEFTIAYHQKSGPELILPKSRVMCVGMAFSAPMTPENQSGSDHGSIKAVQQPRMVSNTSYKLLPMVYKQKLAPGLDLQKAVPRAVGMGLQWEPQWACLIRALLPK
jgi:hypothetical protein